MKRCDDWIEFIYMKHCDDVIWLEGVCYGLGQSPSKLDLIVRSPALFGMIQKLST